MLNARSLTIIVKIETWEKCPQFVDAAYALMCSHRIKPWSKAVFDHSLRNHFALFAHDDSQLLGYMIYSCVAGEGEIEDICIHPQFRKQGIAKKLIEHISLSAQQHVMEYLLLEVNEHNYPAIALYQQSGFEQVGLRKDYYELNDGKYANAIVMKKDFS